MTYDMRVSTGGLAARPVYLVLQSFPVAGFVGALLTDIAYVMTTDIIWADFSAWLLAAGFLMGVLAAIFGLVSLIANRRRHSGRIAGLYGFGSLCVLTLAGFNNLVHSRDAWTSVVPVGLALSVATVVVMLLIFWLGSRQNQREAIVVNQVGAGI